MMLGRWKATFQLFGSRTVNLKKDLRKQVCHYPNTSEFLLGKQCFCRQ